MDKYLYDGIRLALTLSRKRSKLCRGLHLIPEDWNSNNFRHFMECQGHLFFINFDSPEYIIYEMEKDCSKWTVKHRLDINLIVSAFPDMTKIKENSSNSLLEQTYLEGNVIFYSPI